jgi:2-dehydro-3-deoxyphosphooctonate aldolase (KDO 8-P synthase)
MAKPARKIEASGNDRILITERGYTFGYNDLIVDPRRFYLLGKIGYPVIFDITHTIRKYGIPSKDPRGGTREYLSVLSRAGVAAGVDGIFVEAHPNPPEALCDAASQYYLDDLAEFIKPLLDLHNLVRAQVLH